MSRFKGTSQTSLVNSSLAVTAQKIYYIARWVSDPINQSGIAANTWTLNCAYADAAGTQRFPMNTNASDQSIWLNIYVWRPSNGTKVGTICDGLIVSINQGGNVGGEYSIINTIAGSAVAGAVAGDVIVFEHWTKVTQFSAASSNQTIYFDGTVTNNNTLSPASNYASFLQTPENIALSDSYVEVKLYFHDTTSGLPSGTLPSSEQSTKTATSTSTMFEGSTSTNRLMNTTIGTAMVTKSLASVANTSANVYYVTRWVSPPLYQTSIAAGTWAYNFAAMEPSTSANWPVTSSNKAVWVNCYVWKPSNGTKYGTILDGNTAATVTEGAAAAKRSQEAEFTGAAVSSLTSGDAIIVFEAWFDITQGTAAPFTDEYYYDGTTENAGGVTITNHASFLKTLGMSLNFTSVQNYTVTMPTETVTISESLARTYGANRAPATETVTIGEAIARAVANVRTSSDTLAITEALVRQYGANRTQATETVTIAENLTRVYGANRSLSDTVVISESLTKVQTLTRILSETVPISENLARLYGANRSLNDTTVIGENLARAVSNVRTLATQTTAISESLTRQLSANRSLSDNVIILENLARTFGISRALSDTVIIGESLATSYGANRQLSDTVSISESLAKTQVLVRTLSDTIIISENLNRVIAAIRSLSDTVTISEDLVRKINDGLATFSRSLTETTTISENLTRAVTNVRDITETTPVIENIARLIGANRLLNDNVIISENLARVYGTSRNLSDTITISENIARILGSVRNISETIPISENLTRSLTLTRTLAENTAITENLQRQQQFNRALIETVIINEALAKTFGVVRELLETVPITESLDKSQELNRSLVENTPISESLTRNIVVTRTLFEVVTILDNLQTVLTVFIVEDYVPSLLTDFAEDIGKLVTDWMRNKWNIGDPHA